MATTVGPSVDTWLAGDAIMNNQVIASKMSVEINMG